MELEILKNPDIDKVIESELTLGAEYKFVLVTNDSDLLTAEAEIKKAKADQKLVIAKIKPLKEAIDNFKQKFLTKEKTEIGKVDVYIGKQETEISKFKTAKLEEQRKAEAEADRIAKEKADQIKKDEEEKLANQQKAKQAEIDALKVSDASPEEKLEKLSELIDEVADLGQTVVPEIEVKAEKVVLKKDEIKVKKVFSIADEKKFIEWALKNNLKLLEIKISKSAFNEWIKLEENQGHEFLSSKEELK